MTRSPASHPSLPWLLLLLAMLAAVTGCSGGGGKSVPDLLAGVDLSGSWTLTTTVTSATGNACIDPIGTVSENTYVIEYSRSARTIRLRDPMTLFEIVGSTNGTDATLDGSLSLAGDTTSVALQLRFTTDGNTCSGTVTTTETSGADNCTTIANVTGRRSTGGMVAFDIATFGADPPASPIAQFYGLAIDGGVPEVVEATTTFTMPIGAGTHDFELLVPQGEGYVVIEGALQSKNVGAGQVTPVVFTVLRETSAVAWLDFAGNLLDRTGNGHDGTAVGAVAVNGASATFSGGRVELANSGDFRMNDVGADASPYTLQVRIAPTSILNSALVAKGPSSGLNPSIHAPCLYLTTNFTIFDVYFIADVVAGPTPVGTTTTITLTSSGDGLYRIYFDGVLAAEGTQNGCDEPTPGDWTLTLGKSFGFPGGFLNGEMSEFVFFAREFSATEVATLAANGPMDI